MRRALLALLLLAATALPAAADTRWLVCKYNDNQGKAQGFHMMFDEDRNITGLFDPALGTLTEGRSTFINFQLIRTRFPDYSLTYNRNNGNLAVSLSGGGAIPTGLVQGECRRSAPPPGAPRI